MAEKKTPLIELASGEFFDNACRGPALVIGPEHTHADILRYICGDIGVGETYELLLSIDDGSLPE